MITHNKLTFNRKYIINNVTNVLLSGHWAEGTRLKLFEEAISNYFNKKYAIGVASGISALRLSLLSLGVKKNDNVLIPSYCCVAIPNAVLSIGAIPIPCEVDESTFNINIEGIKYKNAKCIIVVNTFGYPNNINKLLDLNMPIIEDASHGFACNNNRKPLKSKADITIMSMYATKLLGCGEGGCIITNNKKIYNIIKYEKNYTDKLVSATRFNDKLSDIHSCIAYCQLKSLCYNINKRAKIADHYSKELKGITNIVLPKVSKNRIWYRFVLNITCNSKGLYDHFRKDNIMVEKPINNWLTGEENCKISEKLYQNNISLPIYPSLTRSEQNKIIIRLKDYYE